MDVNLRLPEILRLAAELRRVRVSGRSEQGVSGEGDLSAVRRNRGKSCNGAVIGELFLIGAIVIHGPDLFVAAAVGNKIDPGSDQTGGAELFQDVSRELLSHFTRSG